MTRLQYMRAVLTPENREFARRAGRVAMAVGWGIVVATLAAMVALRCRYGAM